MDAARQAVSKFTSRKGHNTEVDELVQPGVTSEVIKPHRHEETTEAIDREVHQHHHHTTVQPISHQEILPEKHSHNLHQTEEREFIHGNPEEHKTRLAQQAAAFKNSSTTHETRHTSSAAPAVTGEHVHHHVHEIVQPIIHKETVQPEVVHTTHPIHEVHHHHATHHGMSALPMKTLDEFKGAGGILTGSKSTTHEKYDGEPRPYNRELETTMEKLGLGGHHGHGTGGTTGTTGHAFNEPGRSTNETRVGGSPLSSGGRDSGIGQSPRQTGEFGTGIGNTSNRGTSGKYESSTGTGTGKTSSGYDDNVGRTSTEQPKKQSFMSRLNPMKDSDGDGKKGVMD